MKKLIFILGFLIFYYAASCQTYTNLRVKNRLSLNNELSFFKESDTSVVIFDSDTLRFMDKLYFDESCTFLDLYIKNKFKIDPAYEGDLIIGDSAWVSNIGTLKRNVIIGGRIGKNSTTAHSNTFVGWGVARDSITNAHSNVGIGRQVFRDLMDGYNNNAIGRDAQQRNVHGISTNSMGRQSLLYATSPLFCNVIGGNSVSNDIDPIAVDAIGFEVATTSNVSYSFLAGYQVGKHQPVIDSCVILGSGAAYLPGPGVTVGSNKLLIDNRNDLTPFIYGDFQRDTLRINAELSVRDTLRPLKGIVYPDGTTQTTASAAKLNAYNSDSSRYSNVSIDTNRIVLESEGTTEGRSWFELNQTDLTLRRNRPTGAGNARIQFLNNQMTLGFSDGFYETALYMDGNGIRYATDKSAAWAPEANRYIPDLGWVRNEIHDSITGLSGGGTTYTAGEGLILNGTTFEWGGTLSADNEVSYTLSGTTAGIKMFDDPYVVPYPRVQLYQTRNDLTYSVDVGYGYTTNTEGIRLRVSDSGNGLANEISLVAGNSLRLTSEFGDMQLIVNNSNELRMQVSGDSQHTLIFQDTIGMRHGDDYSDRIVGSPDSSRYIVDFGYVKSATKAITTKTSDFTIANKEYTLLLDGSSTSVTAILPSFPRFGQIHILKAIDITNTVDITGTIDGTSGYTFSSQYEAVTIQFDGTNWWIISKN